MAASMPSTKVKGGLGVPALGRRAVRHHDHVVDPGGRRAIPAVRQVEDVAAHDRHADLVPVGTDVVVGRAGHLQHTALVQRELTRGQPLEQGSGLVILVRDEAVHRHRAVHDHRAHDVLLCLGLPENQPRAATSPSGRRCPTYLPWQARRRADREARAMAQEKSRGAVTAGRASAAEKSGTNGGRRG
jgi:hypothetical protein